MAAEEQYSISGDFPTGKVRTDLLQKQIEDDGAITTPLLYINTSGDTCSIWFDSALSAPEKTALDALVAAHIPGSPLGPVAGAALAYGSANTVTVGTSGDTSRVESVLDEGFIEWFGELTGTLPADLDTGAETADTWYAVHVIGDSTGTNPAKVLFSLSATAPTLPAGYDLFFRVGYVRNDASSDFIKFYQSGRGTRRSILYDVALAQLLLVNNGSATVFTTVDCSSLVPPIGRAQVYVSLAFNNSPGPANPTDDVRIRPADSTTVNSPFRLQPGLKTTAAMQMNLEAFTDANQQIQYRVSVAQDVADVGIIGYVDELV